MIAVVVFVGFTAWHGVRDLRNQATVQEARIRELKNLIESPVAADNTTTDLSRELVRLEGSRVTATNIGWRFLGFAAGLYGVALLTSAMYWHSCLVAFGHHPSIPLTIGCHILGQVGKYIPGKAMVVLIRASALHRLTGIGRIPAVVGVFVETLTMMACGATLAGIAVVFVPAPWWIRGLAVGLAVAAAIPTLPPLFHIALRKLSGSKFGRSANFEVARYDWRLMMRGWAWMSLTWIMIGSSFWMVVLATPGASKEIVGAAGFATASATIALAMVAGFLSLIPGGAGVRELVITALLAALAGPGVAFVAAIMARLIFLTVECLASGLSWLVLQKIPTADNSVATDPAASNIANHQQLAS